jgi:hypothetical protein
MPQGTVNLQTALSRVNGFQIFSAPPHRSPFQPDCGNF